MTSFNGVVDVQSSPESVITKKTHLFQNSGGDLKELEAELEQLNQKDAKLKATANVAQEQIVSEERKLKTLQKNIKIDEEALVKKENQMQQVNTIVYVFWEC